MKKRNAIRALALGAALTGAVLQAGCLRPQALYGPPPEEEERTLTDLPASGAFNPSQMEIEDVYGPPPWEEEETQVNVYEPDAFDPSDMDIEPEYGPPPWEETVEETEAE